MAPELDLWQLVCMRASGRTGGSLGFDGPRVRLPLVIPYPDRSGTWSPWHVGTRLASLNRHNLDLQAGKSHKFR